MRLIGVELSNFRSIGKEGVRLTPFRKCNILIGKNNVGKSNVIKALEKIPKFFQKKPDLSLEDRDLFRLSPEYPFHLTLRFKPTTSEDDQLAAIAQAESFDFRYALERGKRFDVVDTTFARINRIDQANALFRQMHLDLAFKPNASIDTIHNNFLSQNGRIFSEFFIPAIPQVEKIPEFRKIEHRAKYEFSGAFLIEQLARFQHPEHGKDADQQKFTLIEKFVRELLHLPSASLEVAHDKSTILLKNDGLRLPLDSYGTGVHELIILVTAVLSMENMLCCIEEPEIHLHPTLQREFIEFITTHTNNQYLISTHSPTLINAQSTMPDNIREDIQVFHLELADGATVGGPVLTTTHNLHVLNDLGVKASDILQSNCILWVEGPSDRVYLNRWLELCAPNLIEGLHYSIMFYGGRLLSHLNFVRDIAGDEKVPEELIEVLKINQHAMVLIDSDKQSPRTRINETKRRIHEECEKSECICWITDGREVENYVSPRVIGVACAELVGKPITFTLDPFEKIETKLQDALTLARAKVFDYSLDKVKFARVFARYFEAEDISDKLRKRLEQVIEQIHLWNK